MCVAGQPGVDPACAARASGSPRARLLACTGSRSRRPRGYRRRAPRGLSSTRTQRDWSAALPPEIPPGAFCGRIRAMGYGRPATAGGGSLRALPCFNRARVPDLDRGLREFADRKLDRAKTDSPSPRHPHAGHGAQLGAAVLGQAGSLGDRRDHHARRQSRFVFERMTASRNVGVGEVPDLVSVSIVSHGHAELAARLFDDLRVHKPKGIEVILTLNIDEALPFDPDSFPFPVRTIRNATPRGFAANHNAAFELSRGNFFCVLNPDIRVPADPFWALVGELRNPAVGAAAPLILDPDGAIEDSARPFPTLSSLVAKALGAEPQRYYEIGEESISPDWVGGMFMLLRREAFAAVGGFDARYYLYYEDVDLCARLRLAGYDIRLVPRVSAVHLARRQSRRDIKYLVWHLRSMIRYILSRRRKPGKDVVR